ncbi:MAG: hypothetical protein GFH27_549293n176 [Chloroflexi bacterium AL-W]|nr:hypothetical protein [Chloroflexi bacterium AL-N1]NOK67709.1 hypothetical protein [Chloroflexi bacterium AL-N10]NOK75521.1 hypothetical protein [Chloroflexi bacterium AL-N5]NOK82309.1 hypothetical protein [Chloroflexi bacterium AL-W]NOK90154.1 hypothetical protein [Chloroflexi bacterium AL-N15]
MTATRTLLITIICWSAIAWFAGPPGQLLVVLPLLLFTPGYLATRALRLEMPSGLFIQPALWISLSLSIIALLYQWTTVLGIVLSTPVLMMVTALCALGAVWQIWRAASPPANRLAFIAHAPTTVDNPQATLSTTISSYLPQILLLTIFGLTLWMRFVQITDLALPSWVDSVHHALIVRVAAEQGAVPYSLRPYMDVDTMVYHWGYHVFTAVTMQLSNIALPQAILWGGQVLNALHVLTCAALAAYLWRRPTAGVVAGLIVGLISLMPAYYVSWGRYTQLTGLLLLPPLIIAWHRALHTRTINWYGCVAILLAGLSCIHFRVTVFALTFMTVIGIIWLTQRGWTTLRSHSTPILFSAGLTTALALPWLIVLGGHLLRAIDQTGYIVTEASYNSINTNLLWSGQNPLLVTLALVGSLWGIKRRSLVVVAIVGWFAGLIVLSNLWLATYFAPALGVVVLLISLQHRRWLIATCGGVLFFFNPWLVSIPASWLINNDSIMIILFIPAALLISGGVCWLFDSLYTWYTQTGIALLPTETAMRAIGGVALVAVTIWGIRDLQGPSSGVVNNNTIIATSADVAAIDWVAENTPSDARFLINATTWLPGADRGIDGGWWIMPLTGRWTSAPPLLYSYGTYEYAVEIQERNRAIIDFQPDQFEQLEQLIEQNNVTHIYLGRALGSLTPEAFEGRKGFTTVYTQNGITILAVDQQS